MDLLYFIPRSVPETSSIIDERYKKNLREKYLVSISNGISGKINLVKYKFILRDPIMEIGRAIYFLDKSKNEIERIRNSVLQGEGVPFQIFDKYAAIQKDTKENPYWKKTYKLLRISGFRAGKANQHVIAVILKGLKDKNEKCEMAFWKLYRNCVIDMLHKEFESLNNLMLKREIDSDSNSTEEILKSIKKYSDIHEVKNEDIRWLYQAWWFERIDNIDEILNLNEISIEVVIELIKESQEKQSKISESIISRLKELEKKINEDLKDVEFLKFKDVQTNVNKELRHQIATIDSKIETKFASMFEGRIEGLKKRLEEGIESAKDTNENEFKIDQKKLSKYTESITKRIESLETKLELVHSEKKVKIISDLNEGVQIKFINTCCDAIINKIVHAFDNFLVSDISILKKIDKESSNIIGCDFVGEPSVLELADIENRVPENANLVTMKSISGCFIEGAIVPYLAKNRDNVEGSKKKIFIEIDEAVKNKQQCDLRTNAIALEVNLIQESFELFKSTEVEEISLLDEFKNLIQLIMNQNINIPQAIQEQFKTIMNLVVEEVGGILALSIGVKMLIIPFVKAKYGNSKALVLSELLKARGI